MEPTIHHHGAVSGVTGSCHQYVAEGVNLLIDCGLFQGDESDRPLNEFGFDVSKVTGLVVTHCHIDHVGRIPWLIAAGFGGPIWCTEPTAALLPLVLDIAGQKVPMNARIHRLSGLSAHADQQGLLAFCGDMGEPPKEIRLVHGDQGAKTKLQQRLVAALPLSRVTIPA